MTDRQLEEVVVPLPLQDPGIEVPYTPEQLAPTIRRLRDALEKDIERGLGTPQLRLASAWNRIQELRLPRKAVPNEVLAEIEELMTEWDRYEDRGIQQYANSLDAAAVEREVARIRAMLECAEAAAALGYTEEVVPTE